MWGQEKHLANWGEIFSAGDICKAGEMGE